jgi:restriction endonuclease S subunit
MISGTSDLALRTWLYLPAEIALRRKQYEYYRDKLLTFQPLE